MSWIASNCAVFITLLNNAQWIPRVLHHYYHWPFTIQHNEMLDRQLRVAIRIKAFQSHAYAVA